MAETMIKTKLTDQTSFGPLRVMAYFLSAQGLPKMSNPYFKILIFALVTLLIVSFLFQREITNLYYLNKYKKELDVLNKCIVSIVNGDYKLTTKLSTADSNILRPIVFNNLQNLLKGYNSKKDPKIMNLTVEETKCNLSLFVDIKFDNKKLGIFHVKMIRMHNHKWLVDSFSLSD